jgi:hypothetical protein
LDRNSHVPGSRSRRRRNVFAVGSKVDVDASRSRLPNLEAPFDKSPHDRSGASGVHPTPEAPASRTVGSAAPASPMCHIAPWMRLPLAPPFCAHPRRCGGRSRGIALRAEKRGKAPACAWSWKDAVSATRRFESSRPSQPVRSRSAEGLQKRYDQNQAHGKKRDQFNTGEMINFAQHRIRRRRIIPKLPASPAPHGASRTTKIC